MEWYWVMMLVIGGLALYFACGVTSLWLAKMLGQTLHCSNGEIHGVFYCGPLFLFVYVPLYIAQRLGYTINW